MSEISKICPICSQLNTVEFPSDTIMDVLEYQMRKDSGEDLPLIQDFFPDFTADQREMVMTGICSNCFPSDD